MAGRILIADSIANNRIALKAALAAEYFETTSVGDPEQLVNAVTTFNPDIILLATHLGDADGYAICKKLKLNPLSSHISVMMFAHCDEQIEWGKALVNLVDDMQLFPAHSDLMMSRLRQMYRTKVELDTLKTHATATEQFGFDDSAITLPLHPQLKSNIAVIHAASKKSNFVVAPSIGHSYHLESGCKNAEILPNTNLIVLCGADAQFQLLSNLKADPHTKNIPVICVLSPMVTNQTKRIFELGGEDCLAADVSEDKINARIQSIVTAHRHKAHFTGILEQRVKEACFDPLTGIFNRRHAQKYLTTCFQTSTDNNRNLVAMMLDIDKFKVVNDTLGHVNGDIILQQITKRITKNIRTMDMVARMGGEEFLILIPDTTLEHALEVAERLRTVVEERPFNLMAGKISQKITVSIGLAKRTAHNKTANDLVHNADLALYKAKAKGRNCISVSAA